MDKAQLAMPRLCSPQLGVAQLPATRIAAAHMATTTCVRRVVSLIVLLTFLAGESAWAGAGNVIVLPRDINKPNKKLVNGITAEIDHRWTDGFGYRPVTIKLMTRMTKADRRIQVMLAPGSYSSYNTPMAATVEVEIPQGKREVSKTFYIPQQNAWQYFRVEFFEDGRRLDDISMDTAYNWSQSYNNDGSPTVMLVDNDLPRISGDRLGLISRMKIDRRKDDTQTYNFPDAEKFQFLANRNYNRQNIQLSEEQLDSLSRSNDSESLQFVQDTANLEMIPHADLPTSHIGLAGVDLLVISLQELTQLSQESPERFKAIDFHVRSGGNLIVFGEGQPVAEAAALLKMQPKWSNSNTNDFRRTAVHYQEITQDNERYDRKKQKTKAAKFPTFQWSSHGLGQVVVLKTDDPYKLPVGYWQWVFRSMGADRMTWSDRHGIAMTHNNPDYWKFLIPGFGAAPVKGFLFVISAFILAVGPLNFYLLKKARRLYLLPITVAVAALLTTICMMAYALVSDGISTRTRLRSYTLLEQTADRNIASTHCRHAYVAAIAPSQGLVFPIDTCVYPILPVADYNPRRAERLKERQQQRVLTNGYLRSRATTQFLTTQVQEIEQAFAVPKGPTPDVTKAVNKFGVPVTYAWVYDADGNLFEALDTDVDQTFAMKPANAADVKKQFLKLQNDHRPVAPEGLEEGTLNRNIFGNIGPRYYNGSPVYASVSLLARNISVTPNFFSKPHPNSYIAITSNLPPFIAQATEAQQLSGFHIIRGSFADQTVSVPETSESKSAESESTESESTETETTETETTESENTETEAEPSAED